MRKVALLLIAVLLACAGPVAYAEGQEPVPLTDVQIGLIRANCLATQSTIGRIHANDGLLRVNLGRQFEVISARLMAPMNSRIALNKLDNVEMTKTTVAYNAELERFRSLYQAYEQVMSDALSKNCQNQPVAFYDTITTARTNRQAVRDSVVKLQELVRQYNDQFDAFSAKVLAPTKGATP